MSPSPDTMLSPPQVATMLGKADSWVRSLCHAGKIPGAVRNARGQWKIPAESVGNIQTEREKWSEWTVHELELLGTDTDARIGAQIGRGAEAVRDMRTRNGIPVFPSTLSPEEQITRMTSERLQSLHDLIEQELLARAK